ncbi:MAG: hypothetical protein MJ215_05040 [Spirochaetia bacterium]|nr:hypothetical protein [Spirochaetia bacterium]
MNNYLMEAEVKVPYVRSEIKNATVSANSQEEAIALYGKQLNDAGFDTAAVNRRNSAIPGIVFFSITLFMSFFRYFESNGFHYVMLYPNIAAVGLSLLVYSSFVIRVKGLENTFRNFPDMAISILFILVMGIFIGIFMGSSTPSGIISKALGKIGIPSKNYLLVCSAIVLSWLGMKQICSFIWAAVIILGLMELTTCGVYMGNIKSSVFLISAFCGFIFYLKYEGRTIINSFKRITYSPADFLRSNADTLKQTLQETAGQKQIGEEK